MASFRLVCVAICVVVSHPLALRLACSFVDCNGLVAFGTAQYNAYRIPNTHVHKLASRNTKARSSQFRRWWLRRRPRGHGRSILCHCVIAFSRTVAAARSHTFTALSVTYIIDMLVAVPSCAIMLLFTSALIIAAIRFRHYRCCSWAREGESDASVR